MKCNLNPTNYINTTALVMWNVSGTHTRTKPMGHNFTHSGNQSPEAKRWVLRADLNDTMEDIYFYKV